MFWIRRKHEKCFSFLHLSYGTKEKSNLHWISAIYLSRNISNHQQNLTLEEKHGKEIPLKSQQNLKVETITAILQCCSMLWLNMKIILVSFVGFRSIENQLKFVVVERHFWEIFKGKAAEKFSIKLALHSSWSLKLTAVWRCF